MGSPTLHRDAQQPVLFVAREPDETLRTFLPVVDRLRSDHRRPAVMLFHHTPGDWARAELSARDVPIDEVALAGSVLPPRLRSIRGGATLDEIGRFWRARALARAAIERHRPSAVVVIQDTLLLERFLVLEANRRGIPTFVVQWAFSYEQAMYDRIRTFQYGQKSSDTGRGWLRRLVRPVTRTAYGAALRALGLHVELVNSYGGGEARQFAVIGEAFREQFERQGVRGKRISVTGHPTHDAVFERAASIDDAERSAIRRRYQIAEDRTLVLYATQPVLWRKVMTRETLERNVRAIAGAVAAREGCGLVVKLHPREDRADYAFCDTFEPPVRVITEAEMPDLIAACDLFISSSSSTILLAMMLDRPIVTVNFDDVPHFDQFDAIGGTIHVRTHADFTAALHRLLDDPAARDRRQPQRRRVNERYTRFDGHAAERIAGLIARPAVVRQLGTDSSTGPAGPVLSASTPGAGR
jgi:glycosyltransferase involved in cell wall biosynthesis